MNDDATGTIVYRTRRTLTMNPNRPVVSHVAVRDGRILATGAPDEIARWGDFPVDDRFADKVLVPGFVEGHSHVTEGAFWRFIYVGFHDRMDPDGRVWPGLRNLAAVIERLIEQQRTLAGPDEPLIAWGFDPIYFDDRRCTRADLDRVSDTRIVILAHASGHIINANSAALKAVDWLRPGISHPGIPLGADGLPDGMLKGPEAMGPLQAKTALDRGFLAADPDGLARFARIAQRKGVTTATDLASPLTDDVVDAMRAATSRADYGLRIVPLLRLLAQPVAQTIERAIALAAMRTDRFRPGIVKVVVDGSIQGYSARLRAPGYIDGSPNGLWYIAPAQLREILALGLAKGVHLHLHTNGDEATELVLDTMTELARSQPLGDHRTTLQHCQLADDAQFRRMKALGLCVNLFANHTFYWGDEHVAQTVGPERAERMNACASAIANGVPFSIHSDAPVTPLAPLFTAWCAVNRLTSSGRLLGAAQRIPVEDALRAITIGAAYTLGLDGELGSIQAGKRADFAVLDEDPLAVAPAALRDVPVWGTVLGGRVFAAADA